jgi:hypothetical protein
MRDAKLHILQHSLGVDEFGRGRQYRNHFVTGEGSIDHPHCMALVEMGLMTKHAGSALTGGDDLFHVTEAGRRYVVEHSPAPPKLSRSKSRYREYLEADSSYSLGDWLKLRRYEPEANGAISGKRASFVIVDEFADMVPF